MQKSEKLGAISKTKGNQSFCTTFELWKRLLMDEKTEINTVALKRRGWNEVNCLYHYRQQTQIWSLSAYLCKNIIISAGWSFGVVCLWNKTLLSSFLGYICLSRNAKMSFVNSRGAKCNFEMTAFLKVLWFVLTS